MPMDAYGGQSELGVFEKTGFFRIVKRQDRFLFVTPEGNGMWLRACYSVDITDGGQTFVDALHAKYRTDPTYPVWGYWWPFVAQAVRLLRENGFNALGGYTSNYALPVESYSRGRANSERMAFIGIVNAAHYSKPYYGVKNLMYGVDPEVTPDLWRVEGFPDVFDPAFAKDVTTHGGAIVLAVPVYIAAGLLVEGRGFWTEIRTGLSSLGASLNVRIPAQVAVEE